LRTAAKSNEITAIPDLLDAAEFSRQIQAHWQIENSCHWVLDVSCEEDASRVRRDHGAQNLGLLRSITLNLIKRKRARWNDEFMAQLLGCTLPDHKAPPPAPTARNWWGG
jgi:predicted transposase YbfD/YdcC